MIIVRCLGVVSILIPGNIVTYINCRPRIALREQTLKVNVTYVRLVCHVACVWFLQYHHYPRNKNEIRQKEAKKEEKGRWKKTKHQLLQFGIILRVSVSMRLPFFKGFSFSACSYHHSFFIFFFTLRSFSRLDNKI